VAFLGAGVVGVATWLSLSTIDPDYLGIVFTVIAAATVYALVCQQRRVMLEAANERRRAEFLRKIEEEHARL
jgi:hypothetical protein